LKFDWDPEKNETNLKKHGVTFEEAETVLKMKELLQYTMKTTLNMKIDLRLLA